MPIALAEQEHVLTGQERAGLMLLKNKGRLDGSHDVLKRNFAIESEVSHALRLKREFYTVLNIRPENQPEGVLAFAPWLDRAKFERLRSSVDLLSEDGKRLFGGFKNETVLGLITSLRERYSSEKSTIRYKIKNGKLYSELFPSEPFENALLRGLEYQKGNGSKELIREEKEVEGFLKIQKFFSGGGSGRIISCSPRGMSKNTSYSKWFVDIWTIKQDASGRKYAEMSRFNTGLDYSGYRKSVLRLDPSYFEGQQYFEVPVDAWMLSRPIIAQDGFSSADELYEEFFERDYKVRKEALVEEITIACVPLMNYFVDELCKETVAWEKLAIAFNAIPNFADTILERKEKRCEELNSGNHSYMGDLAVISLAAQVDYWGRQMVKAVAAGCGISVGFTMENNAADFLVNSVAKFGIVKQEFFECVCGWKASAPLGEHGACGKCGLTKQKAKEQGIAVC